MDKEHPQTLTEDTLGATKGHLAPSDNLSVGFLVFLWGGGFHKCLRLEKREGKNGKEDDRHIHQIKAGSQAS